MRRQEFELVGMTLLCDLPALLPILREESIDSWVSVSDSLVCVILDLLSECFEKQTTIHDAWVYTPTQQTCLSPNDHGPIAVDRASDDA